MTEDERLLLLAVAAAVARMLDDGASAIEGDHAEQRRRLHALMVKVISADVPRPLSE